MTGPVRNAGDSEFVGDVQALLAGLQTHDNRPTMVLLDFRAAITRLRHTQAGPGQELAPGASLWGRLWD